MGLLVVVLAGVSVLTIRLLVAESSRDADVRPTAAPRVRATRGDIDRVQKAIRPDGLIAISIQRFKLHTGRLPTSINELLEPPAELDLEERWKGPYINTPGLLNDPWGSPYQYRAAGPDRPDSYDLWSAGPDGLSGSADDITN